MTDHFSAAGSDHHPASIRDSTTNNWLSAEYAARTVAEIAADLGCSAGTVRRRPIAFGIPIRSKSERAVTVDDPAWMRDQYQDSSAMAIF